MNKEQFKNWIYEMHSNDMSEEVIEPLIVLYMNLADYIGIEDVPQYPEIIKKLKELKVLMEEI